MYEEVLAVFIPHTAISLSSLSGEGDLQRDKVDLADDSYGRGIFSIIIRFSVHFLMTTHGQHAHFFSKSIYPKQIIPVLFRPAGKNFGFLFAVGGGGYK